MNTVRSKIKPGERWWGGTSAIPANKQGYGESSEVTLEVERLGGQSAPVFLSSKGRYIHARGSLKVSFKGGEVIAEGEDAELVCSGECLRDGYLGAMRAHFPFEKKPIPERFFTTAQYNTWMEYTYDPTEEGVLKYAHDIVDHGYTPGILIIDEGWHSHYGVWEFDFHKFPTPKRMIDELHSLGFTVMLWVVPYVTADGREFLDHYSRWARELKGEVFTPRLARQKNGDLAVLRWWNGFSAMLDMTNEADAEYLDSRLTHLMRDYGVDGFKFDGGNIASLSRDKWLTEPPVTSPEELNKAWNDFGARYTYHEYKDTYDRGGRAVVQRIRDRYPVWEENGLGTLVPIAIMQGLIGYPYICPDMIGGGEWQFTINKDFRMDEELFVRMAECSSLFPMMQFSWAPWHNLTAENERLCLEAAKLHEKFKDKIVSLVNECMATGEPIIRSMEYSFPHSGYIDVYDQFMLGEDILVCPVLKKGTVERVALLPLGEWRYRDGKVYSGGRAVSVSAPLGVLPYFEKIK